MRLSHPGICTADQTIAVQTSARGVIWVSAWAIVEWIAVWAAFGRPCGGSCPMAGMLGATIDVPAIRARFSSLGQGFAFLDAPGGSQVPDEVGDAIAAALREASANLGAG